MFMLTLYRNRVKVCRAIMGCRDWAFRLTPVILGMGYAVKIEKINQPPERNEFERLSAEKILNEAYAKFDNLHDLT